MASRINKRPKAIHDLEESGAFIGRDSLDAELRFYDAAEATFKKIADMPRLGRKRSELANESLSDVRSFPIHGFKDWLVFYRPALDGIDVIRVLHGARDLNAIFMDHES